MKTITIRVHDNKVDCKMSDNIELPELIQAFASISLSAMNQVVSMTPEEHKDMIKGDIYDKYNYAASRVLELFAPEFELRPNLTARAILKAENEILEAELNGKID